MSRRLFACALVALAAAGARADLLSDVDRAQADAEHTAHAIAVDALRRDRPALDGECRRVAERDRERRDRHEPAIGLGDECALLAAAIAPSAAARRTAVEQVRRDAHDEVRTLATQLGDRDDVEHARLLLADDRHDRRAAVLNNAVRPFGLGSNLLAVINPVLLAGSALDSIVTTTKNILHYDRLSFRQREALALYHGAVERDAAGAPDPELARASLALSRKRREALCKDALGRAHAALEDGQLARARTQLRRARSFGACDDDVAERQADLDEASARAAAQREALVWPVADAASPRDAADAAAQRALALAVVRRQPATIESAAARQIATDDDGPLAPGAELSRALAARLRGDRAETRRRLEDVEDRKTPVGQWARGTLAGPELGGDAALSSAEWQHRRDVARYVALGGASAHTALGGAAQVAAYGASGAQTFGIANAIGLLARAYTAWRHDPARNDDIVARGEEYLARHPDAADADDVHHRLSDAYARAERYDRALLHLKATKDPDADDVAHLEDKLADQMLAKAAKADGDPTLLVAIAESFPTTDAAEKARKALEKRAATNGLVLDRDALAAHPELLGPRGLGLPPGLLDGDDANGELADEGVTLDADALELHLVSPQGDAAVERRPLDETASRQAHAAADTLLYREAVARIDRHEDAGRFERYIPFFISGTLGDAGVSVQPGIKLRPYRSDHPERYQ